MSSYITFGLLVDCSIKAAVLLAMALLASLPMRRASAARRHLLWSATLGACLLIPALSALLPPWQALPNWNPVERSRPRPSLVDVALNPAVPKTREDLSAAQPPLAETPTLDSLQAMPTGAHGWYQFAWRQWAMLVWLAGMVACLVPVVVGTAAVWRIRRRATLATSAVAQFADAKTRVLLSERCHMPMVAGVLQPAIILPADAEAWEPVRLRSVIAHEQAHLHRRDCLWQLVGRVARATYWFNPLAWLVLARLLADSERACDDAVLDHGSQPSDYAEHLLAIASSGRSDGFLAAAAIAMAGPNRLEGRLLSILDATRNHQRVTLFAAGVLIAVVAGLAVPLAMLRAAEKPATSIQEQAATAPASRGRLDFRAAATLTASGDLRISPERQRELLDQLGREGPEAVKASPDLMWVETDVAEPFLITGDYKNKHYVLLSNSPKHTMLYDGTWGLTRVYIAATETQQPAVGFDFDDAGAARFSELTSSHLKQELACVIDGRVASVAMIQSVMSRSGMISASRKMEVDYAWQIIRSLNAGIIERNSAARPTTTRSRVEEVPARPGAIRLRVVPATNPREYPVVNIAPGDPPTFTWDLPAEPKVDYLGLFIVPVPRSDVQNLPQQQLWKAMSDPTQMMAFVLGFPGDTHELKLKHIAFSIQPAGPVTIGPVKELKDGFYLVVLAGYQGSYNPQEGRQPVAQGTCVLKVGNPTEPPKPDYSKLLPDQMQAKVHEWVEDFFSSNYRDITARKTIEWGQATTDAGGNWVIRYKYEATIWNKDKATQDKVFTFTPEGGFVAVKDVTAK